MISVCLVNVDYYMSFPVRDLDISYSEFRGSEVRQVPVIQIFGTTSTGKKACLHVHGVFPYVYIPYDGTDSAEKLSYKIAIELDKALNISLGQASSNAQHISNVVLVSGIPIYGYHEREHQFFKIFFYNPGIVKKACALLENGAILGKCFQPHESHINYVLQFMIDFNLHGMSFINLSQVKYRYDPKQNQDNVPRHLLLPPTVQKRSISELEIDGLASDILNRLEIKSGKLSVNPGLAALWDEEKQRRRNKEMDSQMSFCLTQNRVRVKSTATHKYFKKILYDKLKSSNASQGDKTDMNLSVYPIETPEDSDILSATACRSMLDSTILDDTIRENDINTSQETNIINTSQDSVDLNDTILPLYEVLCDLREDNRVEEDSVLSQQVKEVVDEIEESSDDELDLSQALKGEDSEWNDLFWQNVRMSQVDSQDKTVNDDSLVGYRLSQLDGNDDSSEDETVGNCKIVHEHNLGIGFNINKKIAMKEDYVKTRGRISRKNRSNFSITNCISDDQTVLVPKVGITKNFKNEERIETNCDSENHCEKIKIDNGFNQDRRIEMNPINNLNMELHINESNENINQDFNIFGATRANEEQITSYIKGILVSGMCNISEDEDEVAVNNSAARLRDTEDSENLEEEKYENALKCVFGSKKTDLYRDQKYLPFIEELKRKDATKSYGKVESPEIRTMCDLKERKQKDKCTLRTFVRNDKSDLYRVKNKSYKYTMKNPVQEDWSRRKNVRCYESVKKRTSRSKLKNISKKNLTRTVDKNFKDKVKASCGHRYNVLVSNINNINNTEVIEILKDFSCLELDEELKTDLNKELIDIKCSPKNRRIKGKNAKTEENSNGKKWRMDELEKILPIVTDKRAKKESRKKYFTSPKNVKFNKNYQPNSTYSDLSDKSDSSESNTFATTRGTKNKSNYYDPVNVETIEHRKRILSETPEISESEIILGSDNQILNVINLHDQACREPIPNSYKFNNNGKSSLNTWSSNKEDIESSSKEVLDASKVFIRIPSGSDSDSLGSVQTLPPGRSHLKINQSKKSYGGEKIIVLSDVVVRPKQNYPVTRNIDKGNVSVNVQNYDKSENSDEIDENLFRCSTPLNEPSFDFNQEIDGVYNNFHDSPLNTWGKTDTLLENSSSTPSVILKDVNLGSNCNSMIYEIEELCSTDLNRLKPKSDYPELTIDTLVTSKTLVRNLESPLDGSFNLDFDVGTDVCVPMSSILQDVSTQTSLDTVQHPKTVQTLLYVAKPLVQISPEENIQIQNCELDDSQIVCDDTLVNSEELVNDTGYEEPNNNIVLPNFEVLNVSNNKLVIKTPMNNKLKRGRMKNKADTSVNLNIRTMDTNTLQLTLENNSIVKKELPDIINDSEKDRRKSNKVAKIKKNLSTIKDYYEQATNILENSTDSIKLITDEGEHCSNKIQAQKKLAEILKNFNNRSLKTDANLPRRSKSNKTHEQNGSFGRKRGRKRKNMLDFEPEPTKNKESGSETSYSTQKSNTLNSTDTDSIYSETDINNIILNDSVNDIIKQNNKQFMDINNLNEKQIMNNMPSLDSNPSSENIESQIDQSLTIAGILNTSKNKPNELYFAKNNSKSDILVTEQTKYHVLGNLETNERRNLDSDPSSQNIESQIDQSLTIAGILNTSKNKPNELYFAKNNSKSDILVTEQTKYHVLGNLETNERRNLDNNPSSQNIESQIDQSLTIAGMLNKSKNNPNELYFAKNNSKSDILVTEQTKYHVLGNLETNERRNLDNNQSSQNIESQIDQSLTIAGMLNKSKNNPNELYFAKNNSKSDVLVTEQTKYHVLGNLETNERRILDEFHKNKVEPVSVLNQNTRDKHLSILLDFETSSKIDITMSQILENVLDNMLDMEKSTNNILDPIENLVQPTVLCNENFNLTLGSITNNMENKLYSNDKVENLGNNSEMNKKSIIINDIKNTSNENAVGCNMENQSLMENSPNNIESFNNDTVETLLSKSETYSKLIEINDLNASIYNNYNSVYENYLKERDPKNMKKNRKKNTKKNTMSEANNKSIEIKDLKNISKDTSVDCNTNIQSITESSPNNTEKILINEDNVSVVKNMSPKSKTNDKSVVINDLNNSLSDFKFNELGLNIKKNGIGIEEILIENKLKNILPEETYNIVPINVISQLECDLELSNSSSEVTVNMNENINDVENKDRIEIVDKSNETDLKLLSDKNYNKFEQKNYETDTENIQDKKNSSSEVLENINNELKEATEVMNKDFAEENKERNLEESLGNLVLIKEKLFENKIKKLNQCENKLYKNEENKKKGSEKIKLDKIIKEDHFGNINTILKTNILNNVSSNFLTNYKRNIQSSNEVNSALQNNMEEPSSDAQSKDINPIQNELLDKNISINETHISVGHLDILNAPNRDGKQKENKSEEPTPEKNINVNDLANLDIYGKNIDSMDIQAESINSIENRNNSLINEIDEQMENDKIILPIINKIEKMNLNSTEKCSIENDVSVFSNKTTNIMNNKNSVLKGLLTAVPKSKITKNKQNNEYKFKTIDISAKNLFENINCDCNPIELKSLIPQMKPNPTQLRDDAYNFHYISMPTDGPNDSSSESDSAKQKPIKTRKRRKTTEVQLLHDSLSLPPKYGLRGGKSVNSGTVRKTETVMSSTLERNAKKLVVLIPPNEIKICQNYGTRASTAKGKIGPKSRTKETKEVESEKVNTTKTDMTFKSDMASCSEVSVSSKDSDVEICKSKSVRRLRSCSRAKNVSDVTRTNCITKSEKNKNSSPDNNPTKLEDNSKIVVEQKLTYRNVSKLKKELRNTTPAKQFDEISSKSYRSTRSSTKCGPLSSKSSPNEKNITSPYKSKNELSNNYSVKQFDEISPKSYESHSSSKCDPLSSKSSPNETNMTGSYKSKDELSDNFSVKQFDEVSPKSYHSTRSPPKCERISTRGSSNETYFTSPHESSKSNGSYTVPLKDADNKPSIKRTRSRSCSRRSGNSSEVEIDSKIYPNTRTRSRSRSRVRSFSPEKNSSDDLFSESDTKEIECNTQSRSVSLCNKDYTAKLTDTKDKQTTLRNVRSRSRMKTSPNRDMYEQNVNQAKKEPHKTQLKSEKVTRSRSKSCSREIVAANIERMTRARSCTRSTSLSPEQIGSESGRNTMYTRKLRSRSRSLSNEDTFRRNTRSRSQSRPLEDLHKSSKEKIIKSRKTDTVSDVSVKPRSVSVSSSKNNQKPVVHQKIEVEKRKMCENDQPTKELPKSSTSPPHKYAKLDQVNQESIPISTKRKRGPKKSLSLIKTVLDKTERASMGDLIQCSSSSDELNEKNERGDMSPVKKSPKRLRKRGVQASPKYSPLNVIVESPKRKRALEEEFEEMKRETKSFNSSKDLRRSNLEDDDRKITEDICSDVGELEPVRMLQYQRHGGKKEETNKIKPNKISGIKDCDSYRQSASEAFEKSDKLKTISDKYDSIKKNLYFSTGTENLNVTIIEESKICTYNSSRRNRRLRKSSEQKYRAKEERFLEKLGQFPVNNVTKQPNGDIVYNLQINSRNITEPEKNNKINLSVAVKSNELKKLSKAEQYDLENNFFPVPCCSKSELNQKDSYTSLVYNPSFTSNQIEEYDKFVKNPYFITNQCEDYQTFNNLKQTEVRNQHSQIKQPIKSNEGTSSFDSKDSENSESSKIDIISLAKNPEFIYKQIEQYENYSSKRITLDEDIPSEKLVRQNDVANSITIPKIDNKSIDSKKHIVLEQITHNLVNTSEVTNNGTKIMMPKYNAPTYDDIASTLSEYNIPQIRFQQPFYSDHTDVTGKMDVGYNVLKIPSKTISDLEEFSPCIDFCGLENWRKNVFKDTQSMDIGKTNLKKMLAGYSVSVITPSKPPPTRSEVMAWLKSRVKEDKKEELKVVEKTRIHIPMSPGNESLDGSFTLSPCSPMENVENDLTSNQIYLHDINSTNITSNNMTAKDFTSNVTSNEIISKVELTPTNTLSPSLYRRGIRKKIGNLQRKALFTQTILSQKSIEDSQKQLNNDNLSQKSDEIELKFLDSDDINSINSLNISISNKSDETKCSFDDKKSNINQNIIDKSLNYSKLKPSDLNLSESPGHNLNESCQITGVSLNNTHGFKMSYENLQEAKALAATVNLTVMVVEIHTQARNDLNPDPDYDSVRAIFYSILNDIKGDSKKEETGAIVVDTLSGSPNPKGVIRPPILHGTGVDIEITYTKSEIELFDEFVKLIRKWDPDIFAGYEIEMFSWGYLIQRGYKLEINLPILMSRLNPEVVKPKNLEHDDYDLKIPGRIILDVWRLLRHEIALQSYTFENMMYHVLHERVPLHSYKDLSFWWEHRTNIYRSITANYYILRVQGVLKILDQLDLIGRTSELAKLFGIQFYEVLSRGSQFRVESLMLRLCKPQNYISVSPSVPQRAKMRAPEFLPLILEPESRLYTDPVIVLDFQSLYPSIIIAYNYCFATCIGRVEKLGTSHPFEFGATQLKISPSRLEKLEHKINFSPCGVGFVRPEVRKGILPRMLQEILETRLMVKNSMKENKENKLLQRVLHSRQLGLKLIANVTYGYTAANFSGRMPCIEVGDSVVSKGRETLERAIKMIETNEEWGVRVVYGDTDSLFVLVPGRDRKEAFRIGYEIAEAVTNANPSPVKLKLEKILQPCILQTKKRYCGYMYESADQREPEYLAKGIETVRRDGCPAVAKMLEKCLRMLFETCDVSLIKKYVVRQFGKIITGRASIQDLIFAKEYRGASGYKPGACVPALELAKKWRGTDKRKEPRRGQRVPYIIVNGPPGLPLIRLVRSPYELLTDPGLRPNALYYITKVIIPPINRCFTLFGADLHIWFSEMPRKQIQQLPNEIILANNKKSTISQYFATMSCAVCGNQTRKGLCEACLTKPQSTVVALNYKLLNWEHHFNEINQICQSCCSRSEYTDCFSLDCPVLYRLNQTRRDSSQAFFVRNLIECFTL